MYTNELFKSGKTSNGSSEADHSPVPSSVGLGLILRIEGDGMATRAAFGGIYGIQMVPFMAIAADVDNCCFGVRWLT